MNDDVDDNNIAYAIVTAPAASADPNYDLLNAGDVGVSNTDDDTAGFTVSAISGHTAGATDIAPTTEELRGSETGASPFNLKIQ